MLTRQNATSDAFGPELAAVWKCLDTGMED